MANKNKIAAVIGVLCEAFNRKPTAATFTAYEKALGDISDELLDEAGNRALCSTREFMPTPGQLRELAVTGGIGYEARAERAWMEFDRAVSRFGPDKSVSFADGLINATVRMLGDWVWCCGRVGDDYSVWLRRAFAETYMRLCVSGVSEYERQPLMGNLWCQNAIFPDRILSQLRADTGQVHRIETSQPVLLPPTEAPKRLAERDGDIPQLEFKKP